MLRTSFSLAGKDINVIRWSDAGLSLYSSAVVAADRFLTERPDVAKRFMRAFDRSVRFTHEHPELAAADLHTMVPEVDAAVATAQIGDSMPLTFNEITEADGLGAMTPERIATTWDWVARANELSVDSLDPETIVNRDFMPVAE